MADLSNVKLSNVIGAPFDPFVLEQLYLRSLKNSGLKRSAEDVLFLANKTAWARLISSVNIHIPEAELKPVTRNGKQEYEYTEPLNKYIENLGLTPALYPDPNSLAKNWILEAGTSKAASLDPNNNTFFTSVDLRYGIGPDGAYGLGGTEELGYRPMPGLTSVHIETAGRLGSLRFANINFKVWNLNQLNVMEALYFRLGYTMLLEWGHTQYYLNPSRNTTGFLQTADQTYGINDPFAQGNSISTLQQAFYAKKEETSGNYDGMIGVVSSFNWSLNPEGGYDCMVKLIGKGSIIESLRINQSNKMPGGTLADLAQQYQQEFDRKQKEDAERAK